MNLSKITGAISELFQKAGKKNVTQTAKVADSIKKGTSKEIAKTLECLANSSKAGIELDVSKILKGKKSKLKHDILVDGKIAKEYSAKTGKFTSPISVKGDLSPKQYEAFKETVMNSAENGVENGIKSAKESFSAINAAKENAYLQSQLANKSASSSASVFENNPKVQQQWLKEDLMQKHGEKFSARKAQAQRKADLMARYGNKLAK
ncbi:hypothetical protein IJX73_02080 [bacterium]|nr:hypothetical protein [bacterium]MBQ9149697.1 hypothetical protein [bacterium]